MRAATSAIVLTTAVCDSGPLLLNALLQHLGTAAGGQRAGRPNPKPDAEPDAPAWLPAPGSAAFGYWCAALLGVTSAAKARCPVASGQALRLVQQQAA